MRQILSGFLATAMIVSVASSISFAASSASIKGTVAAPTISTATSTTPATGLDSGHTITGAWTVDFTVESLDVTLTRTGSYSAVSFTVPVNETKTLTAAGSTAPTGASASTSPIDYGAMTVSSAQIATMSNGKSFDIMIDGALYSGKLVSNGSDITVQFNQNVEVPGLSGGSATMTVNSKTANPKTTTVITTDSSGATATPDIAYTAETFGTAATSVSVTSAGSGSQNSDVEKTGDFFKNLDITKVIRCYGTGDPIPMTEKGVGVDKDLNDQGGVQSGKTLYFMINDETETTFNDDTYWKLKITKGDNAKLIKKITDTTKIFSSALVDANTGASIPGIDFTKRHRYIKVEMNEIFTDDEYKCTLDLRLTPTSKAESKFANQGVDGSEIKIKDFYFWVKNIVKTADNDWKVGVGGLMLNPLENDWNEVTYYDEDGDLAFMKFFADSDVSKFYAKLSTKWEHADYASYFNDQDAYIFDFVGSPKISATSRCDLQIYNPFVNEDGDETIDPSSATIYQVIDGDLFDVTDSFKYEEGDNGEMAYTTRTRFLGTYIICEKPVEEAVDNTEEVPADLVPEDTTPSEVTPDNNSGGKAPANTGKYL